MSSKPDILQNFHTHLAVGDILQRARVEKQLTLDDLEVAIRVSRAHLVAIEEGRLEVLPGRVYALGFIRAYADYVDLDADKIIELLKQQSGEKIAPQDIVTAPAPVLEDMALPTGKIFLLILGALIVLIGAKSLFADQKYLSNETIPPVPQDLKAQTTLLSKPAAPEKPAQQTAQTDEKTASAANAPNPAPAVLSTGNQVVLKAIENVWLEIRDAQRKTIFSRVLAVGEEYWVPQDQSGLTMTLGNAGGLQILVDGAALPFLGKSAQVVRNVVLDHDALKQRLKPDPKKAM